MSIYGKGHTLTSSPYNAGDAITVDRLIFIEDRIGKGLDTHNRHVFLNIKESVRDVADAVKPDYPVIVSWFSKNNCVFMGDGLFAQVMDAGGISVTGYGDFDKVEALIARFEELFGGEVVPTIRWFYRGSQGMSYSNIPLEKPKPALNEFYPYLKDGADAYAKSFLDSTASVLVMLGEPGTGKTSFIRNMIYKHKLNTMLTYDEAVMQSDEFFINYLTDEERYDLLVVEDADALLTSRENDGNKIMSKLLNVSDGLVKVVRKKIIFTTNIQDINKIDDALTRPGRCFDLVRFRSLEYKEARIAAEAAGLHEPEDNQNYTLAEIFNQQPKSAKKERFGFC